MFALPPSELGSLLHSSGWSSAGPRRALLCKLRWAAAPRSGGRPMSKSTVVPKDRGSQEPVAQKYHGSLDASLNPPRRPSMRALRDPGSRGLAVADRLIRFKLQNYLRFGQPRSVFPMITFPSPL